MAVPQPARSSRCPSRHAAAISLAVLLCTLLQQSTKAMPCSPNLLMIAFTDLADTQSTTPGTVAVVRAQLAGAAHPWNPAAEGLQRPHRLVCSLTAVSGPAVAGEQGVCTSGRACQQAAVWADCSWAELHACLSVRCKPCEGFLSYRRQM